MSPFAEKVIEEQTAKKRKILRIKLPMLMKSV